MHAQPAAQDSEINILLSGTSLLFFPMKFAFATFIAYVCAIVSSSAVVMKTDMMPESHKPTG